MRPVFGAGCTVSIMLIFQVEDVSIAKKESHTPDWDFWLDVWKDLSGFEGIVKPTLDQYTAANERATKDKEAEKLRQAERQLKIKERQKMNADRKARRKARLELLRSQQRAGKQLYIHFFSVCICCLLNECIPSLSHF